MGWRTRTLLRRATVNVTNTSLIVVGAHRFGKDPFDPVFPYLCGAAWSQVVLVEANVAVADQLEADIRTPKGNPTRNVPRRHVNVSRIGVCAGQRAQPRTFTSLPTLPGLPYWHTQIGSFNRSHVIRLLPSLVSLQWQQHGSINYTVSALESRLQSRTVECHTLLEVVGTMAELDASTRRIGVLTIDTEGSDCEIVASQDWSSDAWCAWRPRVIIFEWQHCSDAQYAAALRALHRSECVGTAGRPGAWRAGERDTDSYRLVVRESDNAYFSAEGALFDGLMAR